MLDVRALPDESQEDEYESDEAADGLDGGGIFTATPGDEVVGGGQRDVLQQKSHWQFVVQRNQRVSLCATVTRSKLQCTCMFAELASCLIYARALLEYVTHFVGAFCYQDVTVREIRGR